jgi:hypothetical protein
MASNNATIAAAPASFEPPESRNMLARTTCTPQSAIGDRRLLWIGTVGAAVIDGELDMTNLLVLWVNNI